MKVFRVVLRSFGPTYIEADSYIQDASIRFYRGGELLAEYLPSAVTSVEETEMPVQGGIFEVSPTEAADEEERHEESDDSGAGSAPEDVRG